MFNVLNKNSSGHLQFFKFFFVIQKTEKIVESDSLKIPLRDLGLAVGGDNK